MKGLILKDLYTIKLQIIVGAIICLYPAVVLNVGLENMASDMKNGAGAFMFTFVILLISYCFIVPFSSFLLNTLKSDYESGWLKIQRTMPVSSGAVVGAKLISSGIVIGFFTLFTLIVNVIIIIREPSAIAELAIAGPICIGLLQMIAIAPCFPLGMKIGVKKTDGLYLAFVILTAVVLVVIGFVALISNISAVMLRIICYLILPIATALTVFASYKSGKNLIAKDL